MKPRLESLPLTAEDVAIWCEVYLRAGRWPERGVVPAVTADRRDADLMWITQAVWRYGYRPPAPGLSPNLGRLALPSGDQIIDVGGNLT